VRWFASALLLVACTGTPGVTPPPVDPPPPAAPVSEGAFGSYTLRFPDPGTQYLQVELVLPAAAPGTELQMASWTPGSYLIRDYARHVDRVTATADDGSAISVTRPSKDTWVLSWQGDSASDTDSQGAPAAKDVVVRYRLHASTLSVRGNWVEPDFAVLNGAPTYLVPKGHLDATYDVRLELPDAWPRISTALPPHPSGEANRFRVGHYDVLVDSPIVLGDSSVHTFELVDPARPDRTVRHRLVHEGDVDAWDTARSARDVERITAEIIAFWGGIPYQDYTYLNLVVGARGGLEHKESTLMMAHRWATEKRGDRISWLGLVSHEYFHTWNVKRLRPAPLGPFDLSTEVYTKSLWVAEGLTSYYDDLLLRRAGLMNDEEYLDKLSSSIRSVQGKPGRHNRSLEDASHDAWIKYYKRDANHDNVSVSYYTKGSIVGWLLDAEIRDKSGGWRTLDDALRLAYTRHSGERGFTPQEFEAACEEVAGAPLDDFFDRYVRGTEELDYSTALRVFGLRFASDEDDEDDDKKATDKDDGPEAWLGLSASGGPSASVSRIVRDSPAWDADIIVGDEIVAIAGYRVPGGGPGALLQRFEPGDEVELTLSRRGRLRTATLTLAEAPDRERWSLEIDPQATIESRETRKQWWTSALAQEVVAEVEPEDAAEPEPEEEEADE